MKKVLKLASVENASVIRKFSVFFSLVSLLPFVILSMLLYLFVSQKNIQINPDTLMWIILVLGIFSIIGFFSLRKTFINLVSLSKNAKNILEGGNLSERINIDSGDNEVTQLARTFNDVVQQLESNIKELEKSRSVLQDVLMKVASGVSSSDNTDAFMDLIVQTTVNAFDANIGIAMLIDEEKKEFIIKSTFGLDQALYPTKRLPLADGVAGWVIKENRPLLIPRLQKISSSQAVVSGFEPPLIATPLVFQNKVMGLFTVSGKKNDSNFTEDELLILSNISAQLALAIENTRLNSDNQKTYLETITALALAVEARDVYSRGHSDRVGEYSVRVANHLGMSRDKAIEIKQAAQLHDVGKIGINDEILKKPDFLNDFERRIMEQHPSIGEGIIIPVRGLSHLRDPIRHHHESLDGSGYPDHLKGDQIGIETRILAVADSFDAMTTDRPYRKGMSFNEATAELLKYKGVRYDAQVVDALIACLNL
ncbi:MAG: HD domain-containing protein [Planctomycetes bacterium]|nr:HD domain-containing protein [Planctomycetota bacterium]